MLLFLALSLGSALVTGAIAVLILHVRATRRRVRGDFPIVMARSTSLGRVEMPTPFDERTKLLEAEDEARRILEGAEQAAKVLLEAASAAKASAEEELARARAKVEEELAGTRGRMDALRRQCLEELAQLEARRAALAAQVREAEAHAQAAQEPEVGLTRPQRWSPS